MLSRTKGYASSTYCSLSNIACSGGQTYYAMWAAGNFLTKGNSAVSLGLEIGAMACGAVINALTVVPQIHKKFGPGAADRAYEEYLKSKKSDEQAAAGVSQSKHPVVAGVISYGLGLSASISGWVTAVNAHFGVQTLSKAIIDTTATLRTQVGAEALAIAMAKEVYKKYQAYDLQFLNKNAIRIANTITNRDWEYNRALLATVILATFTLPVSSVLAIFFGEPAFAAIPLLEELITEAGIEGLVYTAAASAFLSTLTTLPSVYDYFNKQKHQATYPDTCKTKAIRWTADIAGIGDSAAVALATLVACNQVANKLFDVNPHGYINILTALCALATGIQNKLFKVDSGKEALLNDLYGGTLPEAAPLLGHVQDQPNAQRKSALYGSTVGVLFNRSANTSTPVEIPNLVSARLSPSLV